MIKPESGLPVGAVMVVGGGRLMTGAGRVIIGAGGAGVMVTGGVTLASSTVKVRTSDQLLCTAALGVGAPAPTVPFTRILQ